MKYIISIILHIIATSVICAAADNDPSSVNNKKDTGINITGHVINTKTGKHMPLSKISLKGTNIFTYTDATGHYYLRSLPEGRATIVADLAGYEAREMDVQLSSGKLVEVNFELDEDAILLDNVVVSSDKNNIQRKETASIVNVLTPFIMENVNASNLAQGLNFQPGLRVESNCQNCGFQQVRINGLEGPYSQIMIDNRPLFSSLAGVYGLEHIPANMIERVEVVRGGSSAVYSSNAIGGTINIITKEPKTNSFTLSNVTNLIYGGDTDNNLSLNAALISDDFRTGAMIFGSSRQRGGLDYDKDGYSEIPQLNLKNIGVRTYYNLNYYNKITLEYHHVNEFRRGGNNLERPPHEADITEQTDHDINSGSISYHSISADGKHKLNIFLSAQYIKRKSYYGAGKNPYAYGSTSDKTWASGMQYNYVMDKLIFMPAILTAGVENNYNYLLDIMTGYNRKLEQTANINSIFLQNEWKNNSLSFSLGARMDKHNLINKPVLSPKMNIRYNPAEFVSLRVSYSKGFRGPQAFDEDLHVTAVGGDVALINISPDLKPERSKSLTTSADFYYMIGDVQMNMLIEGFFTNLSDVFILTPIERSADGNLILEQQNGGGAIIKGINAEGMIVPFPGFQFQFGATLQNSRYSQPYQWSEDNDLPKTLKMLRTPDFYGYFTTTYTPVAPVNISLSGVYTGSMLVPHLAGYIDTDELKTTSGFFDITLKASYNFKVGKTTILQINGGIQNIFNSYQNDFDQGEARDAGYIYGPALPRTVFAGVKYSI